MARFTVRMPRRGTVFRAISITVVTLLIVFVALGAYVYKQSVGRFELRRLSLPTRIFADYTPLTAGAAIQHDDVVEKLQRLGYRSTTAPAQPGDFNEAGGKIDVYLRPFTHPTGSYPAQRVVIAFKGGAIA